jgi:pyruvate/2-oxoglutarate dehydrogenase complex dihydrolipoamide acyltransferase (E2) component
VILPKLGLTMDEGTVTAWRKQVGDRVTAGEMLFEVETDKVTMEVEAPSSGYLRTILIGDGETVPVATVIGLIADSLDEPVEATTPPHPAAPTVAGAIASTPAAAQAPSGDRVPASPAARKRAAELGVDLAAVSGTGPGGRIQIEDVERAAQA